MSARRALITGASGQLGSDLTELVAGDWEVSALAHSELDVTDGQALAGAFEAASDLVQRLDQADKAQLTDPRHYNIRWLELMSELKPSLERCETVL